MEAKITTQKSQRSGRCVDYLCHYPPSHPQLFQAMKATMPSEVQDDDLMDDESDDMPSGLDGFSGSDKDENGQEDEPDESDEDEASEDPGFAEDSDAADLLSLDAEVPAGLIDFDGSGLNVGEGKNEEDEWHGISSGPKEKQKGKRKRDEEDGKKNHRRKLRSLPTFASYEDYAKLIEDGPEDNI